MGEVGRVFKIRRIGSVPPAQDAAAREALGAIGVAHVKEAGGCQLVDTDLQKSSRRRVESRSANGHT